MRRGKVNSVVGLRNFQSALPKSSGLVQPVEEVVPAALSVKTHRIIEQPELRRHLLTTSYIRMSYGTIGIYVSVFSRSYVYEAVERRG